MSRRFKSAPYVQYRPLAFRVFGEVRPLMDRCVLPVWNTEDGPPREIVCESVDVAGRQQEMLREGDLAALEAYAS